MNHLDLIITDFSREYIVKYAPWTLCLSCWKSFYAKYDVNEATLNYEIYTRYNDQYYLIEGSIIMDRSIRTEAGERYASKAIKSCDNLTFGPDAGATSIDYDSLVSMYSQLLNSTSKPLSIQQVLSLRLPRICDCCEVTIKDTSNAAKAANNRSRMKLFAALTLALALALASIST